MKRTRLVIIQALLVAAASLATAHADEPIGPGHPRWYGNGSGPVGADLIRWVTQRATKGTATRDPVYQATGREPTGAELISRVSRVKKREVPFDLVNSYGQGAPSAAQLARHRPPTQPVYAAKPSPVVR